jgi:RNA polymerase sigma-70 factor (ECF subfamily)
VRSSDRWFADAGAERWNVPRAEFDAALKRSAAKAFAGREPSAADLDRYFKSLHVSDLALACACALGHDAAWDHFITEFRPSLYRAADAIDPGGGAREAADALYAELYGLKNKDGARQWLFHYFHGRSSLATWLRSLLTQRFVDQIRAGRRHDPLPEDTSSAAIAARPSAIDPDRARFAAAMRPALGLAIAALEPRDRLRLGCYYAQEMTLAQIGRLIGEHEASVSRHLARIRRAIREDVERRLRVDHRFSDREISECFASLAADAGSIDLADWLDPEQGRKKSAAGRSMNEDLS